MCHNGAQSIQLVGYTVSCALAHLLNMLRMLSVPEMTKSGSYESLVMTAAAEPIAVHDLNCGIHSPIIRATL